MNLGVGREVLAKLNPPIPLPRARRIPIRRLITDEDSLRGVPIWDARLLRRRLRPACTHDVIGRLRVPRAPAWLSGVAWVSRTPSRAGFGVATDVFGDFSLYEIGFHDSRLE